LPPHTKGSPCREAGPQSLAPRVRPYRSQPSSLSLLCGGGLCVLSGCAHGAYKTARRPARLVSDMPAATRRAAVRAQPRTVRPHLAQMACCSPRRFLCVVSGLPVALLATKPALRGHLHFLLSGAGTSGALSEFISLFKGRFRPAQSGNPLNLLSCATLLDRTISIFWR